MHLKRQYSTQTTQAAPLFLLFWLTPNNQTYECDAYETSDENATFDDRQHHHQQIDGIAELVIDKRRRKKGVGWTKGGKR